LAVKDADLEVTLGSIMKKRLGSDEAGRPSTCKSLELIERDGNLGL
jgi:hypothetical protein